MNFSISAHEWHIIMLSLQTAILSTAISLPFAIAIAWFLARKSFRGKSVIEGFLHLPLVMPPVVTGYILLALFAQNGFIGAWLMKHFNLQVAFAYPAVVLAAIVVSFPLMTRNIRTAMQMVDEGLEEASLNLGQSRLRTFFRVTLPLAQPGIWSGAVLGFARSLGEFGATVSFAGNIPGKTQTLALAVYSNMQVYGNGQAALRLVIVSIIISLMAMVSSEYLIRRNKI